MVFLRRASNLLVVCGCRFFAQLVFLSGPTCRADHLREVGRLSGGLLICLCAGAVFFCAFFFRFCYGPAWLWSFADVWG